MAANAGLSPFVVLWLFFTLASARIAHLKNIPISVGLLLGALLGLLGLVIVACLPSSRKTVLADRRRGGTPTPPVPAHRDIGTAKLGCDFAWGMRGRLHRLIA